MLTITRSQLVNNVQKNALEGWFFLAEPLAFIHQNCLRAKLCFALSEHVSAYAASLAILDKMYEFLL